MNLAKLLGALLLLCVFAPVAGAQTVGKQKDWEQMLAAAKKEGKVVVMGSPDPGMRNEIVPKFTERYGITVEFIAGRSGQLAERVRIERSSGIYSVDVFMSGVGTTFYALQAEKMLDPIKPILMLPEVTDGSKWKPGKPFFADREEQYVLMMFSSVDSLLFINEKYVKPEEMRSVKDLLNPKWKGKIATQDPLVIGQGSEVANHFYNEMGPEFVKTLYVDQAPTKSHDRRQLMDWLARGVYPICLTCKVEQAADLQNEGFRLVEIFDLEGIKNRVTSSPFLMSLANKAPHPNAARVFVNWMATKEALEIYSRNNGTATLRTDVDESFLNPQIIPKPGKDYVDVTRPEWVDSGREKTTEKMRAVLRGNK